MADTPSQRVKKLREARKASGETETNVWVPAQVQQAIDAAVREGKFPNRRLAIIHALKQVFVGQTM
ncbi:MULTISPECIES: hypothetical protein [Methylobacterium]|jgi:hypothetical protein|uniref:Ribbon-helix-helix protein CopG domain-containing protein n=2 Tax=Methylobacterium TaxID=407 RepID=A0A0C6FVY6_9HYPH|nr:MULTISPECIES: hypothetical protein [Methylobacterium]MBK3399310.1 hypothetical protein [Methylobacterium ajmalii]MBK3412413.1 hypothetical protein [Methylobacterium ajmalii]MBK3421203.1 hypothetical protein [Methylobacterium ajmalii]MBZ6416110.1 hypothetical protein [Methylobacterium sp.]SEP46196.1 hypothetical protein SAMN04487843_12322 [Methylobacterium sp. ap11]